MTREEAIKVAYGIPVTKAQHEALQYLIPELCESEDERIRKEIIEFINWAESRGSVRNDWHQKKCPGNWIAYLEKQKEPHFTKRNALFDECVAKCDPAIMKKVSDKVDEMLQKKQKPAEWSDEDELMQTAVIQTLERFGGCGTTGMQINWLKSLRPHWKPSQEQMEALRRAVNKLAKSDVADSVRLSIMYDNLKKLK